MASEVKVEAAEANEEASRMQALASAVRDDFEGLAQEYAQRLNQTSGYAELSDQERLDAAKDALMIVSSFLDGGDRNQLAQLIKLTVKQRIKQGLDASSILEATAALEDMFSSKIDSGDGAKTLWRAFAEVKSIIAEQVGNSAVQSSPQTGTRDDQLLSIVQMIPFGVVIIDETKKIRYANKSALESMKYDSEDEVLGLLCHDTMCPAYADKCPILDLGQTVDRSDRTLVTKRGEHIPILKSVVPVEFDGESALMETFVEIGEQQHMREALQQLSRAVEATQDVIVITDSTGAVQFVNPAFEQITGYSSSDVMGENLRILKSGLQDDEFYAEMWQTITAGQVWYGDVTNKRKDGTLYEAELTISPMRAADGSIEQFVAIQRDVTDRRHLETTIRDSLERRGRQVQTSTEVAQEIAAATDLDELFQRVVTLTKQRFGYYHAQLFLLSEDGRNLTTVSGSGAVGHALTQQSFSLPVGTGVVGRAVARGEPVLSPDVSKDPEWVHHPSLPATKGEVAVPIKLGNRVLGVLDVQSDQVNALDEEDQVMLVGLAGQIASAIRSVSLLEETQVARQQTEELYASIQGVLRAQRTEDALEALVNSTVLRDYDRASLLIFDRPLSPNDRPDSFVVTATWERAGEPRTQIGTRYNFIEFPASGLLNRETPVLVNDALTDNRLDEGTRKLLVERIGIRCAFFWPLVVADQWIAVLAAQAQNPRSITDLEQEQIASLANQAAVVIQNQRLLQQMERRALWLQTASEVSRAATSILNLDELLPQVVELICERFNLYYAGVFLVDDAGRNAVLQAGSGEAGQQMLATGHSLAVGGTSMIGGCIANREPRIAMDVGVEAVRFDNPLLPETRTELALPLISRGQPLGAMTIQSDQEAAFTREDISVLQTMSDQLANAIQNARLFEEAQESLSEVQAAHQQYLREGWAKFIRQAGWPRMIAYEYTPGASDLYPAEPRETSDVARAISENQLIAQTSSQENEAASSLVAPISLRGEPIGAFIFEDPDQPREWSEDDRALIETVSTQVAMALESARLFEETRSEAGRRALINEVMQAAASSLDVNSLLQKASEAISRRLQIPSAIFSWNQEEKHLLPVSVHDPNAQSYPLSRDLVITREMGPALLEVIDTRGTRVLESLSGQLGEPLASMAETLDLQSAIYVPLISRGQPRGVLGIFQTGEQPQLEAQDVVFAETIASNVSMALENARLYQEAVETAERLTEVDRLKSQFLANMSHELRTPLNSIIGFSRVILKGIDGPLTDLQQQDLEAIYNSGQHLLGLINDILDISKIEAGKMELAFEPGIDIRDIARGVMSTAIAFVKDLPVELQQAIPDDVPTITADARRVRQVLLNLVNNACKFTEEGYVRIEAKVVGEYLHVAVKDSGIGIPEDKLGTIFEAFTQADASPSRKYGGTGLGLTISKSFAELHGGDIVIESTVGVGTTFTLILPIAGPPPELLRRLEEEEEARVAAVTVTTEETQADVDLEPGKLVLCVDDDEGVITLFRRYLEKKGYRVVGLSESARTIEEAKRLNPFAITLDVMMPGKDGWQVIKELKQDPGTRHIPVIMCSIVGDKDRGLSLGATDYLVKPILEQDLIAALDRLDREEGQHRVLVVDDQSGDRNLLRRMIESQPGYEVIEAAGGLEAIDLVGQVEPHIIILDLMMPEVDGFTVLEELKTNEDTRSIPIIIVTAKELTEDDRSLLNSRTAALIQKGVLNREELLEDVAAALRKLSHTPI